MQLKAKIIRHERKIGKGVVADYIQRRRERYNYTFTFNGENGVSYYTVHGQRVTPDQFNKMLPAEIIHNTIHLDGRQF